MGTCICRTAGQDSLPQQDQSLLIRLRHLYLCEQLSTYRIGKITGLDRQRVARLLRKANVPLRPKGAGAVQPPRRGGEPANLPEILAELYVHRHLTIRQIGKLLGIPTATVRNRLRRHGITTRTQGAWERGGRRVLPTDDLWNLYCRDRLSADDVGRMLGASRKVVLRNAHDLGFPVRTGGVAAWSGPDEIELVNALYADELIEAALARHKIPRVPAGGPSGNASQSGSAHQATGRRPLRGLRGRAQPHRIAHRAARADRGEADAPLRNHHTPSRRTFAIPSALANRVHQARAPAVMKGAGGRPMTTSLDQLTCWAES